MRRGEILSPISYEPLTVRNLTRKRKEEQNVPSVRKRLKPYLSVANLRKSATEYV